MHETTDERSIRHSDLEKPLPTPGEAGISMSLSKDLALHLFHLMKEVTKKKATAQTVNAACHCASEIHKILKLNFEMRRRSG